MPWHLEFSGCLEDELMTDVPATKATCFSPTINIITTVCGICSRIDMHKIPNDDNL